MVRFIDVLCAFGFDERGDRRNTVRLASSSSSSSSSSSKKKKTVLLLGPPALFDLQPRRTGGYDRPLAPAFRGSAALVTLMTPKRFVSICARNSSSRLVSSIGLMSPYPALLTSTSSRPKASVATATAWAAACSSSHQAQRRAPGRHTARRDRRAAPGASRCNKLVSCSEYRFGKRASKATRTACNQPNL